MAVKYNLVEKRSNPMEDTSEKKWYATTQSATPLSGKEMTRIATKNTTLAPIELQAALELLADFIPDQLLQGHTVTLPGLGYFRLTFKSKGADSVQTFDPKEMIYDVRPVFVPDKALRERIKKDIEFEDGGVKAGNVNYRTRADYYEATGQGGSTPSEPGGGTGEAGGDDGEL